MAEVGSARQAMLQGTALVGGNPYHQGRENNECLDSSSQSAQLNMSDFVVNPVRKKKSVDIKFSHSAGTGKVGCPHVEGASGSRCQNHVLHVLVRTICFLPLPSLHKMSMYSNLWTKAV